MLNESFSNFIFSKKSPCFADFSIFSFENGLQQTGQRMKMRETFTNLCSKLYLAVGIVSLSCKIEENTSKFHTFLRCYDALVRLPLQKTLSVAMRTGSIKKSMTLIERSHIHPYILLISLRRI